MRYINPFIEGVRNVWGTMLATDIVISKPFVKTDNSDIADVSASVGLSGDATGCVVLCFPMTSAVNAASKFAGVELSADHAALPDALGELANMVTGYAKSKLMGLNCSLSLPSVVLGRGPAISLPKAAPCLAMPCDSPLGRFRLEVTLAVTNGQANRSSG